MTTVGKAEPHDQLAAAGEPLWLKLAPVVFLCVWSGGYTAAKIALAYSEPIHMLALRYMLVLAILLPAWVVMAPPRPRSGAAVAHLAVVGFLIQGCYFGGTNLAISLGASAAVLAIVLALQPLIVAALAPYVLGERAGRLVWLGLALGLAGAVVAITAKSQIGDASAGGIVTACISLLFISAGTLYEKRFGVAHHPVVSNTIQCAVALAVAYPLSLAFETGRVDVTWQFLAALTYLAIGNSIISMTLLFAMIRAGAASKASSLLFLVPAVSSAIAWFVVSEPMPWGVWIGMALAGTGVVLVRRRSPSGDAAGRNNFSPKSSG